MILAASSAANQRLDYSQHFAGTVLVWALVIGVASLILFGLLAIPSAAWLQHREEVAKRKQLDSEYLINKRLDAIEKRNAKELPKPSRSIGSDGWQHGGH